MNERISPIITLKKHPFFVGVIDKNVKKYSSENGFCTRS